MIPEIVEVSRRDREGGPVRVERGRFGICQAKIHGTVPWNWGIKRLPACSVIRFLDYDLMEVRYCSSLDRN